MNYMIYAKASDEKSYGAMDVSQGKVGVGKFYATLFSSLERAKKVADILSAQYPEDSFQVRTADKGRVVYTGIPDNDVA